MSNLQKFINDSGVTNYRVLFKQMLHKSPYHLKYSLDDKRPDLLMIYCTELSDLDNAVVNECNGIVLNKNTLDIISNGMGKLLKIDVNKLLEMGPTFEKIEESEDGTIIKVFFWNDEWIVSTNRRIDSSRTKWASKKSFMELFEMHFKFDLQETLFETLDNNFTYTFILASPLHFHVVPHHKSHVTFISRRCNTTFLENNEGKPNWSEYPNKVTFDAALENIQTDRKLDKRGVVFTCSSGKRYIVDYKWFEFAVNLRYNMPSLKLSYIACTKYERHDFRRIYDASNENATVFDNIDLSLENLVNFTYNLYRESYVKKMYRIPKDQPILNITTRLHNIYRQCKEPITIQTVADVIEKTSVDLLSFLIL